MKIKNWDKYQHYKNRRPPWIKLYRELLDDIDFFMLSGDAVKTLIMLWLIASENEGKLPDIKVLAFRLRLDVKVLESHIFELKNFIDSDMLASCKQSATPETETERELETEKSNTPKPPKGASGYTAEFEYFWKAYEKKGSKANAFKRWKKLKPEEKHDALAAIDSYFLENPDPQFRKDGEGYLNGKLFESVLERQRDGSLIIPRQSNGSAPQQNISTMPTQEEYEAQDDVIRHEDGSYTLPF